MFVRQISTLRPMRLFLTVALVAVLQLLCGQADGEEWKNLGSTKGVTLAERKDARTGFSEYLASGTIDAPVAVVKRILEDIEMAGDYMPYVREVEILKRFKGKTFFYQRIKPPFVTDRDYTLSLETTSFSTPSGTGYRLSWKTANEMGPSKIDSVVRVELNTGYWQLIPSEDGSKTQLTYRVLTSIGESIPSFLVERGNRIALPKIIEAVRKQAKKFTE
jgi:hypothetical protein